ncbi:MAG: GNAT family N-acetyltransferase [Brevefilum sp.]
MILKNIFSGEIEEERPEDIKDIYKVNVKAFKRKDEAEVVDRLRQCSPVFRSYVARVDGHVVGHILFTSAHIVQPNDWTVPGLGLAPLAVSPEFQGVGIGSALCREGLKNIDTADYPFVIVLGHPGYYQRFGFEPTRLYGIRCCYEDVPEECFMIRILDLGKMSGVAGVAYYRPEFDKLI